MLLFYLSNSDLWPLAISSLFAYFALPAHPSIWTRYTNVQ